MNADVRAEVYGNPTAQDYLVISTRHTPSPRKRKPPAVVNTIMRILQDIDFADQYLRVVEEMAADSVGMGEGMEQMEEQKWMRRKRRIEMFQEEVWETFLEGKVENPFKRKLYKEGGSCHCQGLAPPRPPSNVPDPRMIEGGYSSAPFFPARNDASGEAGACAESAAISSHSTLSNPPNQNLSVHGIGPAGDELLNMDIHITDSQPVQKLANDEPCNALDEGAPLPLPHLHPLVSAQRPIASPNLCSPSTTTGEEGPLQPGPQDDPERQFFKTAAFWVREFFFSVRDEALRSQNFSLGLPSPTQPPLHEPEGPKFLVEENEVQQPQAVLSGNITQP
ncbi:hypothetical protein EV426DRAFT_706695 [Tirmania nivea]|nr:hypothetical protein EV426DRAFT_706695 [Tirmania nivea]